MPCHSTYLFVGLPPFHRVSFDGRSAFSSFPQIFSHIYAPTHSANSELAHRPKRLRLLVSSLALLSYALYAFPMTFCAITGSIRNRRFVQDQHSLHSICVHSHSTRYLAEHVHVQFFMLAFAHHFNLLIFHHT